MLKTMVLIILLLASFGSPPANPGQTPDHRSNAGHNPKDRAGDSQIPPESSVLTLIEKNCASDQFKDDADCKATKDKQDIVAVSKLPTANISIQRNAARDLFD